MATPQKITKTHKTVAQSFGNSRLGFSSKISVAFLLFFSSTVFFNSLPVERLRYGSFFLSTFLIFRWFYSLRCSHPRHLSLSSSSWLIFRMILAHLRPVSPYTVIAPNAYAARRLAFQRGKLQPPTSIPWAPILRCSSPSFSSSFSLFSVFFFLLFVIPLPSSALPLPSPTPSASFRSILPPRHSSRFCSSPSFSSIYSLFFQLLFVIPLPSALPLPSPPCLYFIFHSVLVWALSKSWLIPAVAPPPRECTRP